MTAALGALLGMAVGGGTLLIVAGLNGRAPDDARPPGSHRRLTSQMLLRLLLQALVGAVVLAITGWPIAGLAAAVGTGVAPGWIRRQNAPDQLSLVTALATWIETVRDVLRSGGLGLQTAIRATADDAPAAIRAHVQQLVADSQERSFDEALDAFAVRVAHPKCDDVVEGLHLHGAERLGDMLTSVATALHREADLYRRVDAQRYIERLTAKCILYITAVSLVGASLLAHSFLEPYGSAVGQLGLAGLLAIIGFGVWWSSQAARDKPQRRVLAPRRGAA